MTTPLSPSRERWLLLTLAGMQFTNIVDFMIMMPLGPQLTQVFGVSAAQFGLLVSSYNLAAGLSGFLAAFYIDRFDRRRLLLVLYSLFAVATLACGLATSYHGLMAARVAAGVFGGVLGTLVQTIVGDVVPFERRGRAMAVVMTAFSVATVAGVPAGLFLAAHWNWHVPFVALAAVCAVLCVGAAATLPVMRTHLHAHAHGGGTPSTPWSRLRDVLVLTQAHADLIAAKRPVVSKNSCGYNLFGIADGLASGYFDLTTLDLSDARLPPAWMDEGQMKFLLGTDDQGRDILSALMYGARISLLVGVASVLLSRIRSSQSGSAWARTLSTASPM